MFFKMNLIPQLNDDLLFKSYAAIPFSICKLEKRENGLIPPSLYYVSLSHKVTNTFLCRINQIMFLHFYD